jgi:dihydrofolate reductase
MCVRMKVTMIAACGEGGVLSFRGRIPWHLPDEVAHFRGACAGKALLLGRKTWLQMQGWFRDGQLPLVLTREAGLPVPGGKPVRTVPEALTAAAGAGHGELMVLGGGETYRAALPLAADLLLTEVHGKFPGDVFFPVLDTGDWEEVSRVHHEADADHAWAFTIRRMVRRQPPTDKSFPISP